jgi:hypothetical protein
MLKGTDKLSKVLQGSTNDCCGSSTTTDKAFSFTKKQKLTFMSTNGISGVESIVAKVIEKKDFFVQFSSVVSMKEALTQLEGAYNGLEYCIINHLKDSPDDATKVVAYKS